MSRHQGAETSRHRRSIPSGTATASRSPLLDQGKLYLASVMDMASRRVLRFALGALMGHRGAFHGVRAPGYLVKVIVWATYGTLVITRRMIR